MYYAKVIWYNEYEEEEKEEYMILPVMSYAEACEEINRCFNMVCSIFLEEIQEPDEHNAKCIFLPAEVAEAVREANIF